MREEIIAGNSNRLRACGKAKTLIFLLLAAAFLAPGFAAAGEPAREEAPFNIPLKTLGGLQVWSDVHLLADWRIQENLLTGHYRLLDGADVRRAWGSIEDCLAALTRARNEFALSFNNPHLVLLLHGLGRNRKSLTQLRNRLEGEGFQARTVAYASTRGDIQQHAETLLRLLNSLDSIKSVSFVTHSLGALIVRTALANKAGWPSGMAVRGLVMLAPPSNGAELADRLERFTAFRLIGGPASRQLTHRESANLPLPTVRYCIVAGGRGTEDGYNPLIEGDDDGIVGVGEAMLPDTDDFLIVHSLHTVIMDHPQAVAATSRFLRGGRCDAL